MLILFSDRADMKAELLRVYTVMSSLSHKFIVKFVLNVLTFCD